MARTATPRPTARRWGPGTSAIVRALVAAEGPVSQVELASLVGVTQPRVSQVLATLARSRAVSTRRDGYIGRPSRLIDLYAKKHRPKLLEPEQPWYSVRPIHEQADAILDAAQQAATRIVFSADLAPDLLVPWRHPTVAVVYSDVPLDLSDAGFVRAEGRVDATVLVRASADTTLLAAFPPWPATAERLPVADPVQQVWDLLDLGGEDRREGGDRLRRAIIDRQLTHRR